METAWDMKLMEMVYSELWTDPQNGSCRLMKLLKQYLFQTCSRCLAYNGVEKRQWRSSVYPESPHKMRNYLELKWFLGEETYRGSSGNLFESTATIGRDCLWRFIKVSGVKVLSLTMFLSTPYSIARVFQVTLILNKILKWVKVILAIPLIASWQDQYHSH